MTKRASNDHPIHELIAKRWSPYAFDSRSVPKADLMSLFEAARWAASSYNEQPWSYIVATKEEPATHAKILSCLMEANQAWAQAAPVLALGVVSLNFKLNGTPNKAAVHDLGAASCSLVFEATARGLMVHQMIGILPEKARELYSIPQGYEAYTGLAIGYVGDSSHLPDKLKERDDAIRTRKGLKDFLFSGRWGNSLG